MAGRDNVSPVLGLRPMRGLRRCREKLPKPRISILVLVDKTSLIWLTMQFIAISTSLLGRLVSLHDKDAISFDLVIKVS